MAANFGFVIAGELAGMACPGRFADLREVIRHYDRHFGLKLSGGK